MGAWSLERAIRRTKNLSHVIPPRFLSSGVWMQYSKSQAEDDHAKKLQSKIQSSSFGV